MSDSVRPHRRQPTRLPRPWDSPGKNTGVGCHFLLQCMKVKSEREVAQSCPTLCDPMDYSPPGSSVHGIFQARVLEWVPLPSPPYGAVEFKKRMLSSKSSAILQTALCQGININSTCRIGKVNHLWFLSLLIIRDNIKAKIRKRLSLTMIRKGLRRC